MVASAKQRPQLALVTALLLLIAAGRMIHIGRLEMNYDEVWSIWQTFGSPLQVLHWTPGDWPPLYFMSLYGWRTLVGIEPMLLRYFSLLTFLIGIPCLYRVTRRLWNEASALLISLVYGALGYDIYLSIVMRGYAPLLGLTPLALWLMVRYFYRPSLRRALWLALSLTAMFYIHFTSLFSFALLGFFTICLYRRAMWRWWLPVLLLGIAAVPEILAKLNVFATRTGYNGMQPLPPLPEALAKTAATFAGPLFPVWVVLFAIATLLIIFQRNLQAQLPRIIGLIVWIASPIPVYIFHSRLGLFQDPRYMWWVLPGFALWIGWGLSRLPRVGMGIVSVAMVGALLLPTTIDIYQPLTTFGESFRTLKQVIQPGDVVLVDPNCSCLVDEAWEYFSRAYFPDGGLKFITTPDAQYRRIWYASEDWRQDPATRDGILKDRVPGRFFGPPTFLLRLYEGAPDPTGILFENGLRFHGLEILQNKESPTGAVYHKGETIHVRLWWSVDQQVKLDYSTALYLKSPDDKKPLLAQLDGPPQVVDGPKATSQWFPGRYYLDERDIPIPDDTDGGLENIKLTVYQWWDNTRIAAPGVDTVQRLQIGTIFIRAW